MDINVLAYKPVIDKVLAKLKVKSGQKEDMTQECYIALLERQKHLEHGIEIGRGEAYATSICTSRIWDIWKKDNQSRTGHKVRPHLRFDSLSDPRAHRRASKVAAITQENTPQEDKMLAYLDDAILTLPFEVYQVIHQIFILGKTQVQAAESLGISERTVRTRSHRGVSQLRKYFEVEE